MRPLEGIRILDFTHVLAGPFATRTLADMGADVVKVNSAARAPGNAHQEPYFAMWNRNKRALALDMTRDEARATCRDLCLQADVVIDNFSVGVLDRWGVGYDAISPDNPRAIYVQMSGMGEGGPWSNFVTYAVTIQALAGLTYLNGVPGREDIGLGFPFNDHAAGLHAAVATLAAIESRRATGRGQRIDLAQFEVGVNVLGPSLLDLFANGVKARPTGNDLPYDIAAPHGCYPCAGAASDRLVDERWVAIACMTDADWQALTRVMGNPAWAQDPAYATAAGRFEDSATIDGHVGRWTADLDAVDVMERCQAAGVPAGVVQNGVDLVEHDPQLRASGFVMDYGEVDPVLGALFGDRLPIEFERTPCDSYYPARPIGADTSAVLSDWLEMSADDVREGEERGYFR